MSCYRVAATLLLLTPVAALAQQSLTIGSINPNFRLTSDPPFTMAVFGTGFVPSSIVVWNVTGLPTTFVNAGQVIASVPANQFQNVIGSQYFDVCVVNPGGIRSNTVTFQVIEPVRVTDVQPNPVVAGGPQFTLIVNGSGLQLGMVVYWNGLQLATAFISRNMLTATVPATLIANSGTVQITVYHPGHGTLPPIALVIQSQFPASIATVSPASVNVGATQFALTVTGAGFQSGSTVRWSGMPLATTFLSTSQLTAIVPASLTSNPSVAAITVTNPDGTVSNAVSFPITCDYVIGSVGASAAIGAGGGTGAVSVATSPGWVSTATSTAPWLIISGPPADPVPVRSATSWPRTPA